MTLTSWKRSRRGIVAFIGTLVGLACVAGAAPVSTPLPPPPEVSLAIRDVTVVPMTGGAAQPHRTVLIDGDRIVAIVDAKSAIPQGVGVVEGGGRFLFPGLVDAHVHLRRADAPTYVADGVLTVRNMWGHLGIPPLMDQIRSNAVTGPAVISLSPGIDGSPPQWPESELVDKPADADAVVARLVSAGWKTLKVYQSLSLASFDAVAAASKRLGVEFAGHVPTAVPIEHALASGLRSIEHLNGYDRRLSATHNGGTWGWGDANLAGADALVAATVERGVWNIPTLAIYAILARQHPADMRERVIANRRRFVGMLAKAGAHLAAGTDAGIDEIPASGSLLAEIREFEASGLSREQALATATRNGGELLRIPGLGTIAVGAPARLLLLDADPTHDLAALSQVDAVVLDGRILTARADCPRTVTPSSSSTNIPMRFPPLRLVGVAAATVATLACSGTDSSQQTSSVAGTYDTQVSVVSTSEGCSLPVQKNPTVVQTSNNNTVVMLRHAGTTYGGTLNANLSFTTQAKTVVGGGVSYSIVVSGQFTGTTLDANVTLDYGTAPACHVVVRWVGPKQG